MPLNGVFVCFTVNNVATPAVETTTVGTSV